MFETLKRHAFLLGLAGGVVVIGAVVGLGSLFLWGDEADALERQLDSTRRQAQDLLNGPLYSADLVDKMAELVSQRDQQYKDLLDYIRQLGAKRVPLVEGLFPTSTDISLRHAFKAKYDEALAGFMKELDGFKPERPASASAARREGISAELEAAMKEARSHTMYVDPKQSFVRPEWVDRPEAPSLGLAREAQEDIWLMEDLVGIMAAMNADILESAGVTSTTIAHAPLKELIEIGIGGEEAVLRDVGMQAISGRYRPSTPPSSRSGPGGRMPTLSGHASDVGFYKVLPWRLEVVADGAYAPELIRRLRGTESFLSVEAWRMTPITEAQFEKSKADLMAYDRGDYGTAGVVRLEVVGESLIFELPGGRVTTPPTAAPAPTGTETASTGE